MEIKVSIMENGSEVVMNCKWVSVFESTEIVRGPWHWNLCASLACFICRNSVLGQKIPFKYKKNSFYVPSVLQIQSSASWCLSDNALTNPNQPPFSHFCQRPLEGNRERERKGQQLGHSSMVEESHQHGAHWSNGISLVSNPWHHTSKALFIWVDILSVVPGNPGSSRGCNSFSLFGGRRKGGCGEEPGTRSRCATAPLGPGMNLQCRKGGREGEKTHTLRMNKNMWELDPGGSLHLCVSLAKVFWTAEALCHL